jgi:NAD(P)-dependent dehydrogenase (short-subunit alcohol dehydrogenase family)
MLYPTQPTVVVAGAASGIGRATAQLFAERGARVGLIDQNAVQLDSFVAELRQRGADVRSEACDVRNRQDLEHAMHNLASPDGTIHSLVCAAGVLRTAALADMSEEEYDFVFNINTKAFMLCIQAALPYLAAAGTEASVVGISSASGQRPKAGSGVYAASKAALQHLVRGFAIELASRHIRVNAISPGATNTPMIAAFAQRGGAGGYKPTGASPLGRMCEPEDMAKAIHFLCSPDAAMITGAILAVDGGLTAGIGQQDDRCR